MNLPTHTRTHTHTDAFATKPSSTAHLQLHWALPGLETHPLSLTHSALHFSAPVPHPLHLHSIPAMTTTSEHKRLTRTNRSKAKNSDGLHRLNGPGACGGAVAALWRGSAGSTRCRGWRWGWWWGCCTPACSCWLASPQGALCWWAPMGRCDSAAGRPFILPAVLPGCVRDVLRLGAEHVVCHQAAYRAGSASCSHLSTNSTGVSLGAPAAQASACMNSSCMNMMHV